MTVTRKVLNWYARLSPSRGHVTPPYSHVVQIGDPRLRKVSEPVPPESIKTEQIQTIIKKLEVVINRYSSLGMSAPQIGVNMRIFAMQLTALEIKITSPDIVKSRGMTVVPYTVFINPSLKIVDYRKVSHAEGCESVRGFSAEVPRYKEVEISGLGPEGEPKSEKFKDWPARIAQHELDHLDGKLYTDIMDRKTLCCTCWEEVNVSQGKLAIPFTPE
ncbi:peptide deformylase, mitochondrial-like [Cydia splendana]|uniref:peptide deformylase, mitochondrial-like n=1 Tax=Cydia splendana TaxID=1100963 RepID=UPI00211FE156